MKKFAALTAIALAFTAAAGAVPATAAAENRISISGAWALYPMALKWAEEFHKLQPGVAIDVQAGGAG